MTAITIFLLALFVRIYQLDLFPLNHDEATWTLRSIGYFDKFMSIPVACFQGYIQPFFSYLVLFTRKFFSSPLYIVRIPSIIIGVATVILIYQLAKEMYGRKAGLISALLLSFLPWHVIQSRIGVSLILTPFFGCLIFLALIKAIHKKSNIWFLLSCLFLGIGSFYTYQASLTFVPIFVIALLFLRKDLRWVQPRIVLLGILIFYIVLYPLIYLYITDQIPQYLGKVYRMYYHDAPFDGSIGEFLMKSVINLKDNISNSFKGSFFSKAYILYGHALDSPLFINYISFFIILCSISISIFRRKISDKILLMWLGIGYIGALSSVRFHAARYIIGILPPLLIFIGKFLAEIFDKMPKKISFKREVLFFIGAMLFINLISSEVYQLFDYYHTAPFHIEECRHNSYGCKEAAEYLSEVSDVKNYKIITDSSMEPLDIYLNYYLLNVITIRQKGIREQNEGAYYVIWAPESHPEDYRGGEFSWLWKRFRTRYPDMMPVNTIHYPNGLAAIHIFKVGEYEI